ncbi:MAG TPA: GNAT family N-acetyltransferase, partial [Ktedonobacterales bacterium]|nr:GNAT family N-acetyltransferase [Ktedonobacterales bacterium]
MEAPVQGFGQGLADEAQSSGGFYTDERWLDLIQTVYGYRVTRLEVRGANGVLRGYLPVCALSSPLTGRRVVSLPFSDVCGMVADGAATAHHLLDQAVELGRAHRARYVELRTGPSAILAERDDFVAADNYVRWRLALAAGEERIWAGVQKPVQRQVRKSRKLGVTIRFARQCEDMDLYHRLHVGTRSGKHGMPAQPRTFFRGLWDRFSADGTLQVLFAEYEGRTIAGMVLFAAGDTVRYAYGASEERSLPLAPNNLLMWESIAWAIARGYQFFDMGRTARDNQGLMEFKRTWGAAVDPLPYFYSP